MCEGVDLDNHAYNFENSMAFYHLCPGDYSLYICAQVIIAYYSLTAIELYCNSTRFSYGKTRNERYSILLTIILKNPNFKKQ